MRVSKKHPAEGWLHLEPRDYSTSLDRLLRERDKELISNPNASGMPQSFIDWTWSKQIPELIQKPFYKKQVEAHIADLEFKSERIDREIKTIAKGSIEELEQTLGLKEKLEELIKE